MLKVTGHDDQGGGDSAVLARATGLDGESGGLDENGGSGGQGGL